MSQVQTAEFEIRDLSLLTQACARLGLEAPQLGAHRLFDGTYQGYGVKLPAWSYPVVFDLKTGTCRYDDYKGQWGDVRQLKQLQQAYRAEASIVAARALPNFIRVASEQTLENGAIQLEVEVG